MYKSQMMGRWTLMKVAGSRIRSPTMIQTIIPTVGRAVAVHALRDRNVPVSTRTSRLMSTHSYNDYSDNNLPYPVLRKDAQERKEKSAAFIPALREGTFRLLDQQQSPIGQLSYDEWFHAEDALPIWVKQRTLESVSVVFDVLDRLAAEETKMPTLSRAKWVSEPLLKEALRNWFTVYRSHHPWPDTHRDYTPQRVLQRVETYLKVFRNLSWTTRMAYYIAGAHWRRNGLSDPNFVESLIDKTVEEWQQKPEGVEKVACHPSAYLFQSAVSAWTYEATKRTSPQGVSEAAQKIDALLERMESLEVLPNEQIYASAILAWCETKSASGAERAEQLLEQMCSQFPSSPIKDSAKKNQDGSKQNKQDPGKSAWYDAFAHAIQAWTLSGDPHAAIRANKLQSKFTRWQKGYFKEQEGYHPKAIHNATAVYNSTLMCYASTGTKTSARMAEELFEEMKQDDCCAQVDQESLYWRVAALANGGELIKSSQILFDLIYSHQSGKIGDLQWNTLFVCLIDGWRKSNHPDRLREAMAVFYQLGNLKTIGISRDTYTCNAFLGCLANEKSGKVRHAEDATRILDRMREQSLSQPSIRPNSATYAQVIQCWTNCRREDQAIELFKEMLSDFRSGNTEAAPTIDCLNRVLASIAQSKYAQKFDMMQDLLNDVMAAASDLAIQPDVYTYGTLLDCLSKRRKEDKPLRETAEEAQAILQEMKNQFAAGNHNLRPNRVIYDTVMNCWANAKEPEMVEKVLEEMYQDFSAGNESARPNTTSFNVLMKAWAVSGHFEGPERAESVIARMQHLYRDGVLNIRPTIRTYTTLMLSYALCRRPDGAERADALMSQLNKLFKIGMLDESPNLVTYDTLLTAWRYSTAPNKKERILQIEREMKQRFGQKSR